MKEHHTFEKETHDTLDLRLRLSLQRALLDAVPPNMIAVTGKIEADLITIHVFFDGTVTDVEKEIVSIIGAEVIADFSAPIMIEEKCYSLTENPLNALDFWAFVRMQKRP